MTNTTTFRTIHTNLFSNAAKEILDSVMGQLSDGIWENSSAMNKYWMFAKIDRAPNGEVIIKVDTRHATPYGRRWIENGFYRMDDVGVIDFIAGKLKAVVKTEIRDNNNVFKWNRTTDTVLAYLGYDLKITVAMAYCVYDHLLSRETNSRYDASLIATVIGKARGQKETEAVALRQQQIAELEAERDAKRKELEAERDAKIAKIKADYDKKVRAMYEKSFAKISALRNK